MSDPKKMTDVVSEAIQEALDQESAAADDLRKFAAWLAPQIVEWSIRDPEDRRRNLAHLESQALLAAGTYALQAENRMMSAVIRICGVFIRSLA